MAERVNHPSHYGGDEPYETIKVLRAKLTPQEYAGFLKGNAFKYADRHRHKDGAVDVEKHGWYSGAFVAFIKEMGHDTVYPKPMFWIEDVCDPVPSIDEVVQTIEVTLKPFTLHSSVAPHVRTIVTYPVDHGPEDDPDIGYEHEVFEGTFQAQQFIRRFNSEKQQSEAHDEAQREADRREPA